MAVLPDWDENDAWNRKQKVGLAILTYITAGLFIGLLCLALYNHVVFLLRPFQLRKLIDQLSFLYLLSELTILMRILSIFYWYRLYETNEILLVSLPPLFKLNVGVLQAWLITELVIRVNQNIRTGKRQQNELFELKIFREM